MIFSRRWTIGVLVCITLLAISSRATPSNPPAFFHNSRDRPTVISLRAPDHLVTTSTDHASTQRELQHASVARRRSLFARQDRRASTSSTNSNDKIQTLGYLSGAYQVPLNLSSSPAQLVFVQLDTGSSDLWITSTACASSQCQDDKVLRFDSQKSTTFQPIQVDSETRLNLTASSFGGNATNNTRSSSHGTDGYAKRQTKEMVDIPFSIYYDDTTSASGVVVADKVGISDLSVDQQAFALINATNVTLGEQGISGVLGLGFARGSVVSRSLIGYADQIGAQVKILPFLTSLLQTSGASYPLFGLYLTRQGGTATFGAVDPAILPSQRERSQVEWYDVYPFPSGDTSVPANNTLNLDASALGPYVQWVLPLTSVGVSGQQATLRPSFTSLRTSLALLDTGSSSILGPPSAVASIFSSIRNSRHVGDGRFIVPCDTTDRMYFSFGGRNITLLPSDYIIGPDAQQPYLCFAWPSAAQADASGVDWILGTPFLRAVYSVFSIGINGKEPPKVGLYPLRQRADATQSSVVFSPQPTADLSSFLRNHATTINSVLPNSLVSLQSQSSVAYFFANATSTPTLGVVPTKVAAASTYRALLPTRSAATADDLPVIASTCSALPVPGNPASDGHSNSATRITTRCSRLASLLVLMLTLLPCMLV